MLSAGGFCKWVAAFVLIFLSGLKILKEEQKSTSNIGRIWLLSIVDLHWIESRWVVDCVLGEGSSSSSSSLSGAWCPWAASKYSTDLATVFSFHLFFCIFRQKPKVVQFVIGTWPSVLIDRLFSMHFVKFTWSTKKEICWYRDILIRGNF